MMKKFISLFLPLLIAACASTTPTSSPSPAVQPEETTAGAYPAPVEMMATLPPGYPAPLSNDSSDSIPPSSPTIDPNLAQVKGVFQLLEEPSMVFVLYLAPTVKDADGREIVVNFNREIAIPSVPDEKGNFLFVNVPPGNYGLVYDAISTSYLMTEPGKPQSLIIKVNGNETIDLGLLKYENPPNQ
jgi:hypothetical protein